MKIFKNKSILFLVFLSVVCIISFSCRNKPTPPEETEITPIEPEMILIDEDLTFTYLESRQKYVDTSFVYSLEPYYIGKYEVMNQEFLQFILDDGYNNPVYWSENGWGKKEENGWTMPLFWGEGIKFWSADSSSNLPDTPVRAISFYEAEAYCKWLSVKTGKNYGMPTSAQWVRAARGPDPGRNYPWGDEWISGFANYFWGYSELNSVNSRPEGKSYDGCYHMIGNVCEYAIPILRNKHGSYIMLYSGYYYFLFSSVRDFMTYTYDRSLPYKRYEDSGFRICID